MRLCVLTNVVLFAAAASVAQGDFHAEICDQVDGDGHSTPDYLTVSIGFGDSLCTQSSRTTVSNDNNSTVSTATTSTTTTATTESEPEPDAATVTATKPADNDDDYYYDDYGP
jgi:methionine-rich copper-binding protein CopC